MTNDIYGILIPIFVPNFEIKKTHGQIFLLFIKFPVGEGRMLMWSSIVQAPKLSQGQKSSDSSLGSSFGCSLGSFYNSATEGDL